MSQLIHTEKLLRGVAARMRLVNLGRQWRWVFLSLCALYTVALLVSRATGWGPEQFLPLHLPILAVVALAVSGLFHGRPTAADAARKVDLYGQTRDLFLTITMLGNSAGEFQPLVIQSAEAAAQKFQPSQVVQFPWQKPSLQAAFAALIVWSGIALVPQFDPFGKVAEAREAEQRIEKLAAARRATKDRMEELKSAEDADSKNAEVNKALEKLKQVLSKLEKSKPTENQAALAGEQKKLGALWRKLSAEKMAEMLMKSTSDQAFGETGKESLQKWANELQQGKAESLRKEVAEMQDLAERIRKARDPIEKAELQSELKKRTQQLKEFAAEKIQNKALKAALDRALEQLESSKQERLEKEALEGLKESLELAKQELQQIEMSAQEMQQLQEALKTIQMARQLNEEGKLESEADEGFSTMEEYQELYEQLMAEMSEEGAPGDGEGQGGGEPEKEDDSLKTRFKPEQSKSAVKAGKMLLTINTKGVPPSDAAAEEVKTQYRDLVRSVKNSAEEAIQQEQIPPGYHDGIKNYFNSLDEVPSTLPLKK